MSMKLPPEPTENYQLWRKNIAVWCKLTDTVKEKRGFALQYACRNNKKLYEAVLNIDEDQVEGEAGLANVLKVLDALHYVDKIESAVECYEKFNSLRRKENQKVADFILEYETLAQRTKDNGNNMSEDVLTYKLLKAANLSEIEERIVKAATPEFTLENVKKTLKRTYGETTGHQKGEIRITEPIYHASEAEGGQYRKGHHTRKEEEIFYADKWRNMKSGYKHYNPGRSNGNSQSASLTSLGLLQINKNRIAEKINSLRYGKNPMNSNGVYSKCVVCRSIFHWVADCPNQDVFGVNLELQELVNLTALCETSGVITSSVPLSMCGMQWLSTYMSMLSKKDKLEVQSGIPSTPKQFNFRRGKQLQVLETVIIPVWIGQQKFSISLQVMNEDIPLLLSRSSLQKMQIKINPYGDTAEICGNTVNLNVTPSGFYCLNLDKGRSSTDQDLCGKSYDHSYTYHMCDTSDKFSVSEEKLVFLIQATDDAAVARDIIPNYLGPNNVALPNHGHGNKQEQKDKLYEMQAEKSTVVSTEVTNVPGNTPADKPGITFEEFNSEVLASSGKLQNEEHGSPLKSKEENSSQVEEYKDERGRLRKDTSRLTNSVIIVVDIDDEDIVVQDNVVDDGVQLIMEKQREPLIQAENYEAESSEVEDKVHEQLFDELWKYRTFLPIVLINYLYDHLIGLLIVISMIFPHRNAVVKKEPVCHQRRNMYSILIIVVSITAIIAFIYIVCNGHKLYYWYSLITFPSSEHLDIFSSLLWIVIAADLIVKLSIVTTKGIHICTTICRKLFQAVSYGSIQPV